MRSNSQYEFIVKLLFAILPVWHVNRDKIIEINVMVRIQEVGQLMQNYIFHTRNACFIQVKIQINLLFFSTTTAPQCTHLFNTDRRPLNTMLFDNGV